jgi:hypothetical protein
MTLPDALPTFSEGLRKIAAAERGDGWLCACDEAGRFLLPTAELVASLAEFLQSLRPELVLEVCAGRGELAESLAAHGVPIVATDADPPAGGCVIRSDTREALRRYRPQIVLGAFVPTDAGVDEVVLGFPSLRHYVVLGARIGTAFGSEALWCSRGWSAEPLDNVRRWMLTRHDVWLDFPGRPLLQHGEAWHLQPAPKRPLGIADETVCA